MKKSLVLTGIVYLVIQVAVSATTLTTIDPKILDYIPSKNRGWVVEVGNTWFRIKDLNNKDQVTYDFPDNNHARKRLRYWATKCSNYKTNNIQKLLLKVRYNQFQRARKNTDGLIVYKK